jgi:hypothetical protein
VTDFLDQTRKEIADRLKELKPLLDEHSRLQAAAAALAGVGGSASATATTAAPRRRGPGRPRGSVNRSSKAAPAVAAVKVARKKPGRPQRRKKMGRPPGKRASRADGKAGRTAARATGRAGRRKGSGTRAAEALALVQGQPGITVPELAAKMSIKQNYLYRVLPGLEKEKKVEKKGRGWYAKGA